MTTRRFEVPVLVVGGGPTGLTAGILLQQSGIGQRVVERRPGPQRAPAAHVVNARTFEVLRQAGVDMEATFAAAKPPQDAGWVYWVTKLGGEVIGRLPFERQGDDVLAVTPTPLRNLSQHRLEPILADTLARLGAPAVDYGTEWLAAERDADGVTSTLRNLRSGETFAVRSRYLLAADGASSPVRRWLGIEPIGPERLQSFVMIHFAANLRPLVRDCPGVLYWVCDPDSGGTLVAHDIDREWVYMHPWEPEREPRESFSEQHCAELVRRSFVAPDTALDIETISTWTMTAQVAGRYRDGRVFLVGDAAHRFPPTGGLGLNTGVQDAHNLVWKLAAVLSGEADDALLDTYEAERQPIARYNCEQSMKNALRLLEVPQALGLSSDRVASRAQMAHALADPEARRGVLRAIENQAEHFDMLGLQLGVSYETGAVVSDGSPATEVDNPVRDFVPTSRPGARLPHGWVERDGRRVSTLDLIGWNGFTLLAGPEGRTWAAAAREAGIPGLRCLQLGRDWLDPARWWSVTAGMQPGGALLVRPDQHVAFRSRDRVADPAGALARVARALCLRAATSGGEAVAPSNEKILLRSIA